jgi:hypothetical protein
MTRYLAHTSDRDRLTALQRRAGLVGFRLGEVARCPGYVIACPVGDTVGAFGEAEWLPDLDAVTEFLDTLETGVDPADPYDDETAAKLAEIADEYGFAVFHVAPGESREGWHIVDQAWSTERGLLNPEPASCSPYFVLEHLAEAGDANLAELVTRFYGDQAPAWVLANLAEHTRKAG